MSTSFKELNLSPEILKAVEKIGFEEPSPIQTLAIPVLLTGKDAIGQAQTGTGKTAAFGLPVLEKVTPDRAVQSLILCPTRELAIQVSEELSKLALYKHSISVLPIYGGQPIERQLRVLARGAQVVVGTPGRVIDHLQRGTLQLDKIRMIVLDEADEMLDMGFREDIELILEKCPEDCQRILFSATMPRPIQELSKRFLHNPEMLAISHRMLTVPAIEQVYYEVRAYRKMDALSRVLDSQGFRKALVFCATKRNVDEVTAHLQQRGYQADGLHGDLNQTQRDRVMNRFRTDGIEILIATDVAARGIDVDDVDAVINYDIPHDVESYVHRIGRTGRAGREGKAFTFVTVREQYKIREIIRYTKARIRQERLPTIKDVNTIRTSRLLEEVSSTLTATPLDRWRILIEDFQTEQFPDGDISSLDIAAALLRILMQRDFGNQNTPTDIDESVTDPIHSDPERDERPQRKKKIFKESLMQKLQINAGQVHGVTPRSLVGAITGECGIPGRCIGAINIQKHTSIVEIESELFEHVLSVLGKGVFIGGNKVTASSLNADKRDFFRHKTPSSQRRPHPSKFGKKRSSSTCRSHFENA